MGSEAFRRQPCLLDEVLHLEDLWFGREPDPDVAEDGRQLLPEGLELLTRTPDLAHAQVVLETGVFGAKMEVELVNDGPVTLVVDL